ncbi:MAG: membrane protein insertion efficiency factor YidD [Oligoflexia bacterium]|nr:membrane protein insertion efficiency factor YidD [Oligoflexia bacterium]
MRIFFILTINAYKTFISPLMFLLGVRCRFFPSCSDYSLQCFKTLPLTTAMWYTIKRLLKCQPMCNGGYDPVPKK